MSGKRKRPLDQKGELGGDRRVREEEEGKANCRLHPKCEGRHELTSCATFKRIPAEHRRAIVLYKKICRAHLTHESLGSKWERECSRLEDHKLLEDKVQSAAGLKEVELPIISHRPGRLEYECRLAVKIKPPPEANPGPSIVELRTLFDARQRQTAIRNEGADRLRLSFTDAAPTVVKFRDGSEQVSNRLYFI